jgi:DNA-binding transcriptional ArsR family regulator
MTSHDSIKGEEQSFTELMKNLSPEFEKHTVDIREIAKVSSDPMTLSVLLFALAQEREKTNKILEEQNAKFEKMFVQLQNRETRTEPLGIEEVPKSIEVLPEIDQRIMDFVEQKGMAEAGQIMEALSYKGKNAASQRLNKLYREGHLKKVRSGRKVLYLARK